MSFRIFLGFVVGTMVVQYGLVSPRLLGFGGEAEQRMWLVRADGSRRQPFYVETRGEWVTHEVWWGGDAALFTIWPESIAKVGLHDRKSEVLSNDQYWHVGGDPNRKWVVGDKFTGEIYLVSAETKERKLLTSGHIPDGAKNHPHVGFNPAGDKVVFCTSIRGNWDVAVADVDSLEW